MSSFWETTGATREGTCDYCGAKTILAEHRDLAEPKSYWSPVEHLAPCGAHCLGGGVERGEEDVHIVSFGACPRCGETETEIAKVIERKDGLERVSFHRHKRDLEYRIDLERLGDDKWSVVSRWNSQHPDSLPTTISFAATYVPWLKNEEAEQYGASDGDKPLC